MASSASLTFDILASRGERAMEFTLPESEGPIVLVGPNGAGKTTLLGLVLGMLPIFRGHVRIGNTVVFDSDRGINLPVQQRRIAYVPQNYALFPHLSVMGNVEFAVGSSAPHLTKSERRERAAQALQDLGLGALGERSIVALSGGEKQRLTLARALAVNPSALLFDEPLAALDVHSRQEVRESLADYLARLTIPSLIVTHDAQDAERLGRQIAVVEGGRITQVGTWSTLVRFPGSRFAREFVAEECVLEASRPRRSRSTP